MARPKLGQARLKAARDLFQLRARYRQRDSRFLVAHGTWVHFIDEGPTDSALTVIALSSQWLGAMHIDQWAEALPSSIRIIRLDLPGQGLTGPFADGDYSMPNYAALLEAVLKRLNLQRYVLVGTSFSGVPAIMHAARQAPKLAGLVLANASGLPRPAANKRKAATPGPSYKRQAWHSSEFYDAKLRQLLLRRDTKDQSLVNQVMDMNNLAGRLEIAAKRGLAFRPGDCLPLLKKITAPVLIQWSTHSTYLKLELAQQYAANLSSTHVSVSIFEGAGHLILRDAAVETATDLAKFLQTLGTD